MYELDAFKVTHATKYPGPILSVGISPNAALLAVGLANGQLLVRKHSHNKGAVPGLPGVHSHAELIETPHSTAAGVGSAAEVSPEELCCILLCCGHVLLADR